MQHNTIWSVLGKTRKMLHYALVCVGPERVQDLGTLSQSCPSGSQEALSKGMAGGSGSLRGQDRGHTCPSLRAPKTLRDSASVRRGPQEDEL